MHARARRRPSWGLARIGPRVHHAVARREAGPHLPPCPAAICRRRGARRRGEAGLCNACVRQLPSPRRGRAGRPEGGRPVATENARRQGQRCKRCRLPWTEACREGSAPLWARRHAAGSDRRGARLPRLSGRCGSTGARAGDFPVAHEPQLPRLPCPRWEGGSDPRGGHSRRRRRADPERARARCPVHRPDPGDGRRGTTAADARRGRRQTAARVSRRGARERGRRSPGHDAHADAEVARRRRQAPGGAAGR